MSAEPHPWHDWPIWDEPDEEPPPKLEGQLQITDEIEWDPVGEPERESEGESG